MLDCHLLARSRNDLFKGSVYLSSQIRTVGIIYNARIPEALDLSTAIVNELSLEQRSWISPAENLEELRDQVTETELVVTAGGDGTMLRAVQVTAPLDVPMVGINMGRLGFMTELQVHDALEKLPSYYRGDYRIDSHNMIMARIVRAPNSATSEVEGPFHALNDVVLSRGGVSRVVTIRTTVDGAEVASLRADGIILATATGSTGYSLAVGGPILDPLSEGLVLKPVAAHVGMSASLVLDPKAKIGLYLEGAQEAVLSVDGYIERELQPGDRVEIEQSPFKARFLRAHPSQHFYATLTRRLGFSIRGQ
ncbi:NAD kinase [Geodia barretti]|uniref:NAD(+) kinase n=1 Tax=Geodia barretti TaxID=519541 RepID=A0AA35WKI0_GEOBA|nr:NAD kinase [Geodia barretti]